MSSSIWSSSNPDVNINHLLEVADIFQRMAPSLELEDLVRMQNVNHRIREIIRPLVIDRMNEKKIPSLELFFKVASHNGESVTCVHFWRHRYQLTDQDLAKLVKNCPNLKSIREFSSKKITETGLSHLLSLTKLEELDLSFHAQLTNDDLSSFTSLKNLRILNTYHCFKITDQSLEIIAKLISLQELNFSGCHQITDNGLSCLSSLTNLRKLTIGGSCSVNTGLIALTTLTCLEVLDLSCFRQMTNDTPHYIAAFTSLRKLILERTVISDNSLGCFTALTNLQLLDLSDCKQVTKAGLNAIRQANPTCKILPEQR